MELWFSQVRFSPFAVGLTIIFGLAAGSFLNVCIYRIPRKGSVASPRRSYCPHCKHSLSVLDNIPVFSYIFLRGKCRYCKGRISPRYMIVELLTAGLFVLMLHRSIALHQGLYYAALEVARTFIFVGLLIAISFIDLEFTIIPNKLIYLGLPIGLLLAISEAIIGRDFVPLRSRVLGAIIGAAITILIAVVGSAVFRKEAMGMGDVKLMAMIGIYIGWWPHILITLIAASLFGSIAGIALILVRKKKMGSAIPFGPFLAVGALLSLSYGEKLWAWYRHLTGL
jgi:leader peptidase (prepilin peptidase)/N-methyltransferase